MEISFFGSPDFAIPSLQALHGSDRHQIKAVVSNRDKRRGRGGKTSPTPVKKKALELDLPVIEAGEDLSDDDFYNQIAEIKADLFVVVAFRILPDKLLELPPQGSVNLHASLLPKYRGAAPIHWAVMNGETETGCSIFFIESKVDTGDIISQKKTKIGQNETTGDVYQRLKEMGGGLLLEAINQIEDGEVESVSQDDQKASSAPKLHKEDCQMDFDKPAEQVHNKIRGLSPFPTAWTRYNEGKQLKIYRSHLGPDQDLHPAEFSSWNGEMVVGCREGTVILDEVKPEGAKKMSGADFLNGYKREGIFS